MDVYSFADNKVYGLFAGDPRNWVADEEELSSLASCNPNSTYVICSDDASIICLQSFLNLLKVKNIVCGSNLLEKIPLDVLFDIAVSRMEPYEDDPLVEEFCKRIKDLLENGSIFNECKKLHIASDTLEDCRLFGANKVIPLFIDTETDEQSRVWMIANVRKNYNNYENVDVNVTIYSKDNKAVLHKMSEVDKSWTTSKRLKDLHISIE